MLGFPEPKNTRGADWKLAHDWGWIHVWEDDVGTRQADWLVPSRFIWATGTGMVLGMALGMARGSREAGLRFLAENAHRPPKTVEGWYFYRKTKNYRVMLAAGREGGRQGMKLASVCATWATIESVMGDIGGVNKTREEKAERELWRTAAANTRGLVAGAVSAALVPLFCKSQLLMLLVRDVYMYIPFLSFLQLKQKSTGGRDGLLWVTDWVLDCLPSYCLHFWIMPCASRYGELQL
ncbi:hypothetical protein DL96DRAFT_1592111 [Flagelloscypha sp. PMI_526]|nr:hypothetical protein DL96DRAFT_1592111 [Flagelloscypha sp. PMI_526]